MSGTRGVLTIAHGNRRFARQAMALARSIRLHDPHLPLAVATDLPASSFEGMYDHVIPWDFTVRPGLTSKLDMYEMSPFEMTLFLDTDMLLFCSLDAVFVHFADDEFGVIGRSQVETGWFESTELIQRHFGAEAFPRFVGGLYYFVRGEAASRVFQEAREVHRQYDALHIKLLEGQQNDEPMFSLAMTRCGLQAKKARTPTLLINPTWGAVRVADVDVIAGRCEQFENGVPIRRAMLHFYDGRTNTYLYQREMLRLERAFADSQSSGSGENFVRLRAVWRWLCAPPRMVWKLRRFTRKALRTLSLLRR